MAISRVLKEHEMVKYLLKVTHVLFGCLESVLLQSWDY